MAQIKNVVPIPLPTVMASCNCYINETIPINDPIIDYSE